MNRFLLLVMLGIQGIACAEQQSPWFPLASKSTIQNQATSALFQLDPLVLNSQLTTQTVYLPTLQGEIRGYQLVPVSILSDELAKKYQNVSTYAVMDDLGRRVGSAEVTPIGVRVRYQADQQVLWLQPSQGHYLLKSLPHITTPSLVEQVPRQIASSQRKMISQSRVIQSKSANNDIRTYRLAMATSGEYAKAIGRIYGQPVTKQLIVSELATLVNRINPIFEQNMGVNFQLVDNNEAIIFLDPDTDPYTNSTDDLDLNKEVIDSALGLSGYDLGHVLTTDGGGLAGIDVTCWADYKAWGVSGISSPTGEGFYIDYVAHEIGHQLGATHSFNANTGSCRGNRSAQSAFEIGSGSTIMSYAGICSPQNTQSGVDDYFHIGSIEQYQETLDSINSLSATCGTVTNTGNSEPQVEAGADYVIPAGSAFVLTGEGTDPDGDVLTFQWEQMDLGSATTNETEFLQDNGEGPLFRSIQPNEVLYRHFPMLSSSLTGELSAGEVIPSTDRTLTFRFVARDQRSATASDNMQVVVTTVASPLAISLPNEQSIWRAGEVLPVTWDTGGTQLSPINCLQLDVFISELGDAEFRPVATGIDNTGAAQLTYEPTQQSDSARLMLRCTDNVFYSLSPTPFSIQPALISINGVIEGTVIAQGGNLTITPDSLQLSQLGTINSSELSVVIVEGEGYRFSGNQITLNADVNNSVVVSLYLMNGASQVVTETTSVTIPVQVVNNPPVAVSDTYRFDQGTQNNLLAVLSNDTDTDTGDDLTLISVDYNGTGQVSITNNQLVYTPAASFSGRETFEYTVTDLAGAEASAQVIVNVTAQSSVDSGSSGSSSGGSIGLLFLFSVVLNAGFRFSRRHQH